MDAMNAITSTPANLPVIEKEISTLNARIAGLRKAIDLLMPLPISTDLLDTLYNLGFEIGSIEMQKNRLISMKDDILRSM